MPDSRLLSRDVQPEDAGELSLRPKRLREFIGQPRLKRSLAIAVEAACLRNDPLDHTLFYGPPGLGKTTISHVCANEMGATIRVTSGPAIERTGDIAAILTGLEPGSVLFIDEIHRLARPVEELLYSAMEDFVIDLVIGKGPSARTMRLMLQPFTLVGATTRAGLVSAPLRDRFGMHHYFEFYEPEDLVTIVLRSAEILRVRVTKEGAEEIASRSRGTPRIANRLLRRCRDFALVRSDGTVGKEEAADAMSLQEIDSLGLDEFDRKYLRVLLEKYDGGPVGIETLAAALSEERDTIEDTCESYLLQIGFLQRTSRGRIATRIAAEHLGLRYRAATHDLQGRLL